MPLPEKPPALAGGVISSNSSRPPVQVTRGLCSCPPRIALPGPRSDALSQHSKPSLSTILANWTSQTAKPGFNLRLRTLTVSGCGPVSPPATR